MSDFKALMSIVRQDRDFYEKILKFNTQKIECVKDHKPIEELKGIVLQQTRILDSLIGEGEARSNLGMKVLGTLGSTANSEDAIQKASTEIKNLEELLKSLKSILQSQVTSEEKDIPSLLEKESELSKAVQSAYFILLRSMIDYLKNISMKRPLIAVVVPAHNEEKRLQGCLKKIKNQTYPNKIIIVSDNASTDSTASIAGKYTSEVIRVEKKGVGLARNIGGQRALDLHAEIIVFLDADSQMRKDLLDKTWEAVYIDNSKAGICKTMLTVKNARASVFNFLHHLNRIVWKVPHTFMFCTAEVFQKIRFNEDVALGEDVEWSHNVIRHIGLPSFKVITDSWLLTSARRLEDEGYLKTIVRWAQTWPFGLITNRKDRTYFKD